ncbi:MAG: hypothetical protein CSB16_00025 [Clostridiales bacterium]|nr:MAG: hypothetical protein CSB16_00025 [Clostridiales bacterium]
MFEYYLFGIFILIAVVFMDQITKILALKGVFSKVNISFIKFGVVRNRGAMFGFLKSNRKLLLLIHTSAIVFMIFLLLTEDTYFYGLILMAGGGISNLIDRLIRGSVIDWFSFKIIGNLYFNLADFFVFIGVILLLIVDL